MNKIKGVDGMLFIGDPHLWSKKPSRRIDEDFTSVVLDKIEQSIEIANKDNLYPIILGDLFHSDEENSIELLTKLSKILKKSKNGCATVEGNHEKKQTKLDDSSALSLLSCCGLIEVYESNGYASIIEIKDRKILIGSTPYGGKLPKVVEPPKSVKVDFTIWLTHANLDFGDSYPGVQKIEEIMGVDMLVNGHIHKTHKEVKVGKMTAFNPGNITRLSIDCSEHVPSVWKWTPELGSEIEQIKLKFKPEIFDTLIYEYHLDESNLKEITPITVGESSLFVQHMQNQLLSGADLSDDGGYLKESVLALSKAMGVDKEIENEIIDILNESLNE